jgi:hypothetical protein
VLLVLFVEFNVAVGGTVPVTFTLVVLVVDIFSVEVLKGMLDGCVVFGTVSFVSFSLELFTVELVVKLFLFEEVGGMMLGFVELVVLVILGVKFIPTLKGLLPIGRLLLLTMGSQTLVSKFKVLPLGQL